jgi:hypothetical protein
MCGAVSYEAQGVSDELTACHCGMCRRWAGGPALSVAVASVAWHGLESLSTVASSAWAERGFCGKCGSGLFYRVTAPGRYHGNTFVMFGTLDDQSGLALSKEWFFDQKPEAYALAGDHETVTEAEAFALLNAD